MDKLHFSERRTTCNSIQKKKHFTQMTEEEKTKCIDLLKYSLLINDKFIISNHAQQKLVQGIDFRMLLGAIHNNATDQVIEYNETVRFDNTEKRVLIRHPKIYLINGRHNYLYLVINIQTGRIVTAYYNLAVDTHKTLDLSYYEKDLKIIK